MNPGQKNRKKIQRRFSVSTGIKIGSKRPYHILKHAGMQSETRGVQSFKKAQPCSSKTKLKALIVFFRTRYKSFVNSLGDIAV